MVGMTRFERATTRPPDVYSNRAELHPENDFTNAKVILYHNISKKERINFLIYNSPVDSCSANESEPTVHILYLDVHNYNKDKYLCLLLE